MFVVSVPRDADPAAGRLLHHLSGDPILVVRNSAEQVPAFLNDPGAPPLRENLRKLTWCLDAFSTVAKAALRSSAGCAKW
jgi:hypothetical protein